VKKHFIICLALFSISSCGFHLRGAYQLPQAMDVSFIQADNSNSELVRALKRTLKASDIKLAETRQQASAVIFITTELQEKRVLSVDAQGRAREYEISYQISFNVSSDNSDFSIAEQKIKLQRGFLFDTEDVLGKSREQETLVKDMQQDMVRLIMLRLQAAADK